MLQGHILEGGEKVTLPSPGTGIMLFFMGFALLFISLKLINVCT
jgi:hypothetical protein